MKIHKTRMKTYLGAGKPRFEPRPDKAFSDGTRFSVFLRSSATASSKPDGELQVMFTSSEMDEMVKVWTEYKQSEQAWANAGF